jgi:hypothetical protein
MHCESVVERPASECGPRHGELSDTLPTLRGASRRRADAAVDEVSKVTWRVLAEEWMKLADEAELSASRAPPK